MPSGGFSIDWRFFSLEEINREEGKKDPWEREWSYGWGMLRVAQQILADLGIDPGVVQAAIADPTNPTT